MAVAAALSGRGGVCRGRSLAQECRHLGVRHQIPISERTPSTTSNHDRLSRSTHWMARFRNCFILPPRAIRSSAGSTRRLGFIAASDAPSPSPGCRSPATPRSATRSASSSKSRPSVRSWPRRFFPEMAALGFQDGELFRASGRSPRPDRGDRHFLEERQPRSGPPRPSGAGDGLELPSRIGACRAVSLGTGSGHRRHLRRDTLAAMVVSIFCRMRETIVH